MATSARADGEAGFHNSKHNAATRYLYCPNQSIQFCHSVSCVWFFFPLMNESFVMWKQIFFFFHGKLENELLSKHYWIDLHGHHVTRHSLPLRLVCGHWR